MIFKIKRVDAEDEYDTILDLQKQILPLDKPVKPEDAMQWWLAYETTYFDWVPVAYAALSASVQSKSRGYLSAAGVLPQCRGFGLQKRLIRARIVFAREIGLTDLVTDTLPTNAASNNSLIACGFRSFSPDYPWKVDGACYWRRKV